MGPGAHEIHVATGDVHELRKLIEVELSEPPPDPGDAVAVVADPLGRPFACGAHSAKLDQLETLPAQAETFLNEKHRSSGIQPDRQGDQAEERGKADEPDHGGEKTHAAREREGHPGLREAPGEDEGVRRERLDSELSRKAFVDLDAVLDHDSACPRLEEPSNGPPPPPLGERDDNPMGPDQVDDLVELLEWAPWKVKERQFAETRLVSDHANRSEERR